MSRRGTTLIEMLAVIGVILPISGLAMGAAGQLGRWTPAGDGRLAELVCLQLRRDAAGGARIDGAELVAGGRRWQVADGWLCRDGAQRLRVEAAGWTVDGSTIAVQVRGMRLPARTIELAVRP